MNLSTTKISDDQDDLDAEKYLRLLRGSYWASKRTDDEDQNALKHSLCFSIFSNGKWVGGARVVTDESVYSMLCDVIIVPEYRGKGLGKKRVAHILEHPKVKDTRVILVTKDSQAFYRLFGFDKHPFECMMKPKTAQVHLAEAEGPLR